MYPDDRKKKQYPDGVPKSKIEEVGSNPYMIGVAIAALVLIVLLLAAVYSR